MVTTPTTAEVSFLIDAKKLLVTTPTTATGILHYKQVLINAIDVVDDNNGGKLFLVLVWCCHQHVRTCNLFALCVARTLY